MSPQLAPLLSGIERADSIAFDFHKWAQVPYDAGFVLVRDGAAHLKAFDSPATYLRRDVRGLAAGSPWPCDFGPDLSRGFRALKTWFTLKTYGTDRLGAVMAHTCAVARHLEKRVRAEGSLELVMPAQLNIVCFRFRGDDALNAEIIASLQESGVAAPSATTIGGLVTIRAAIFNHRTTEADVDTMVDAILAIGKTTGRR
jgi:glutamate/tyrosine decarboxylase-like PLP-dependent enzyme